MPGKRSDILIYRPGNERTHTGVQFRAQPTVAKYAIVQSDGQAEQHQPMYMRDWKEKLDAFLQFNDREILDSPGTVSAEVAKQLALGEYEKFSERRLTAEAKLPDEDFDRAVKQIEKKNERSERKQTGV